jgi:NAD(P)-dependent dehydrogenase (short-subunit alcohol dehydrogenase family)
VRANADAVASEINGLGGEAIVDTNSVPDEESAKAVVRTALDAWGRVDILVSNAGICILAEFDEVSSEADDRRSRLRQHLDVPGGVASHESGWVRADRCASSGAILGARYLSVYGAAKGAVFSLTRGLAVEGAGHGIKVNAIAPAALTAAVIHLSVPSAAEAYQPAEFVAPVVAFRSHEDCHVTGGHFDSGGGATSFRHPSEIEGYANPDLTLEDVRDNFDRIVDMTTSTIVPNPTDHPVAHAIQSKPYQP